ncbi:UvrD-helicase-domain-containing protein [Dothidotthia symphoricarpi CBS 119687]|uniref:DNA 3'-5' helicase n=1 Tax=Dothidotthia symphoricarpi CBS 119687 TaxID=1392245 RepID=A0A6A6AJR1_9PLEO|nr:UvrD-helicase-domain-containing protein [Dothidotthia symphoricarpi CBS 119687]KAF2132189.1 UvrD-helicase-domain-containing protein [Dothidotthia symphoricarpi CBS 119687]
MDALLEGLNDAQRSAVTSPANVLQVLAPPGSGKTKTLTARVAYHINHERLQPWNIIVCTFTIKAAREMKERIKGFVGEKLESKLILGTFHSVARRFLSRYGQEIGIDKNFGIADTDDSKAIIKRIVSRHQYMVEEGHARSRISGLKAKGISAEAFAASKKKVDDNDFAQVYLSYQEHLKASNLLDYDDLLVRCVELLRRAPSCVSTIQAVLIDEYQDTNNIQYELMSLMAQQTRRITIVGDPDQSIYSFRSAELKNLLRMRDDYPESIVINLENNYRSSGRILRLALAVIEQDESRPEKALVATHGAGEQPTLRHLANANVEAKWIVDEIQRTKVLSGGLLNYNDYSILLRSAALSLSIERELGRAGIPYRMVGGRRFFDRAEIKIVLNYLRVISNPHNNDAVVRVINTPARKVGDTTVKALLKEAEEGKVSLWKLVSDVAKGNKRPRTKLSAPAVQGIDLFFRLVNTAHKRLQPEEGEAWNLLDLIAHILKSTSFESYLKQTYKEDWKDRWANVEELVAQATQMATALSNGDEVADDALPIVEGLEQRQDTAGDILSKFLVNVALATDVEGHDGEEVSQVTISTIHSAKGLEWPIVFIPAVYNGSIPHSRAENHDEERRLLYRNVISDLARILGRPCPQRAAIEAARHLLEHLEDAKYPATRDEIDGDNSSWGTSYDDRFGSGQHGTDSQLSKRRRIEPALGGFSVPGMSITEKTEGNMSLVSIESKGGFISARDAQAIQQEALRMLASAQDAESGKTTYKKETRTLGTNPVRAKAAKPRAAGQGSITSFFARPGNTLSETNPVSPLEVPSSKRSRLLSSYTPLNDISNVRPTISQPSGGFQSLSMPSHKLQARPMASKPKRAEPGSDARHALCLSSPTRPQDREVIELLDDDEDTQIGTPVKQTSSSTFTSTTASRPASTFHTTSMDQIQTQSANRKTLGTRRTMQGWSVKHSQMPKPRPS